MENPVAFVSGASRGIGKASAIALAEAGFDVVVTARTVSEGEKHDYSTTRAGSHEEAMPGSIEITAAEVRKRGRRALPIRLDLLDPVSIDAAVEQALRDWGHIDLLLNNGIYQGPGVADRFLDLTDDLVRRVFEGNVFAQIHVTQQVIPGMLERGHGIIINMTSGAGMVDPPAPADEGGWGFAYGASKGALHRMAGILHVELHARGIRAYNLQPGLIITESQQLRFGNDNPFARHTQSAPLAVPAAVVVWLATNPEAVAMSGQTIHAQPFCNERQLVPGWPEIRA
jgi:NAD(P)-dependent dehydrogenase (short-subunit alcohol dehydrogenase family)